MDFPVGIVYYIKYFEIDVNDDYSKLESRNPPGPDFQLFGLFWENVYLFPVCLGDSEQCQKVQLEGLSLG